MNEETIKLLKKMNVDVKSYIVKRHGKDFEYVIIGGTEVLSRKSFTDSNDEELEVLRKTKGIGIIGEEVELLPFTYVENFEFDLESINRLVTYRDKK